MERTVECPMCHGSELRVLKEYRIDAPAKEEMDEVLENVPYLEQRLWILFERVLPGTNFLCLETVHCETCGFLFSNPRFTTRELHVLNETMNEFIVVRKHVPKKRPLKTKERSRRIYRLISQFQSNRDSKREILDYGGAQGYNLYAFSQAGDACYMLDPARWHLPSNVQYLGVDISDLPDDQLFDVILACHVYEHVGNPGRLIEETLRHLSSHGVLYIEVPLGSFREWEWPNEPTTHINFFSEQPLFHFFQHSDFHILHLSTKYQWVTEGKLWCVNLIAGKQKGKTIPTCKKTIQQMKNPAWLGTRARQKFWRVSKETFFRKTK